MFDPQQIMQSLSSSRPAFHSEADFQHAFAWQIHEHFPSFQVRLEYPSSFTSKSSQHLDIVILNANGRMAIELKYKTAELFFSTAQEIFRLKAQGAPDGGCYDFLKDVQRLEAYVLENQGAKSFAIILSNDSSYWKPARNSLTVWDSFRISNGKTIAGTLSWATGAGKGTIKGRESPIALRGPYVCSWQPYSDVRKGSLAGSGEFRYLLVGVQ